MKVLLLGHEGFVGTGLSNYFGTQGIEVEGWGRSRDVWTLSPAYVAKGGYTAVVNCVAAQGRQAFRYDLDGADHRLNVRAVEHIVASLRGTDVPLIHLSTKDVFGVEVYGPDDLAETATRLQPKKSIDETQKFAPETIYAKSKLISEWIAESHPNANVIRLSTIYGDMPHVRENWMFRLARAILSDSPIKLTRSGKQVRDPLHTDDLGKLILKMISAGTWGRTVHAGGGPENVISLLEFVESVSLHCGKPVIKELMPGGDSGFVFDIARAQHEFDWKPSVSVYDRISHLVENIKRGAVRR